MKELKNPFKDGFKVTSPYGMRTLCGVSEKHNGLDIVGLSANEVRAVIGGKVVASRIVTDKSDKTWQWGNYVCVLGDDGNCIYYCHLASRAVSANDRVEAGDVIGIMGNTGYSFGAHTHFEVRKSDRKTVIAPAEYLGIKNETGEYDIEKETVSPWAEEALLWAADAGILVGGTDSDYMPKKNCTRQETMVFLHRFYEYLKGEKE